MIKWSKTSMADSSSKNETLIRHTHNVSPK